MVNTDFEPMIFTAKTMHKRFYPKENLFTYGLYYLAIPLKKINSLKLFSPLISFRKKNHGARDGGDLRSWIDGIYKSDGEVVLVTMPRIFGYGFNPVSFWFCFDKQQKLRAVLAEVNNTFGETHSYLCAHENGEEIAANDIFAGEKIFHVSPFLERSGDYQFRFDYRAEKLAIWVDHYQNGEKILATNLIGKLSPLTRTNLLKHFFQFPLLTFKVIGLIHYQAIKLMTKGIKYIVKPLQNEQRLSKITEI